MAKGVYKAHDSKAMSLLTPEEIDARSSSPLGTPRLINMRSGDAQRYRTEYAAAMGCKPEAVDVVAYKCGCGFLEWAPRLQGSDHPLMCRECGTVNRIPPTSVAVFAPRAPKAAVAPPAPGAETGQTIHQLLGGQAAQEAQAEIARLKAELATLQAVKPAQPTLTAPFVPEGNPTSVL